MKCTNCGAEFEDGTLFCPVCGKEIQWVPEYNTLETLIRQKELQDKEKKRREMEAQKERERAERKAEQERKRKRKKTMMLAGAIAAVVAAAAGGMFLVYQTQYHSFDFQMAQAETKFSNKNYTEAMKYVERALSLKPDSAEANILEAKIYLKEDNQPAALSILVAVAENDPDNTSAYGELLRLYEENAEVDKIKELMDGANEKMKSQYQGFICELPEVSRAGGNYGEEPEIRFLNTPDGGEIYYTLDGSNPDKSSKKYENQAIVISEEGDTVLKYIAYNKKGIPSDVGDELYEVSFEAPEKPEISPASDKYEYRAKITVTAQEGCTIYYAFDEEPTIESEQYTEPIRMMEGEHTFSAIAVDSRGKISNVASRVYVYYGE